MACLTGFPSASLRPIMETDTTSRSHPLLMSKEADLGTWLQAQGRLAVGFSGGVDSAYLAVAARMTLGSDRVLAIIGRPARRANGAA